MIKEAFLVYATETLAETEHGMSWNEISKYMTPKAAKLDVNIPHVSAPLAKGVPNKRTAFLENLKKFNPQQQFAILSELVEKKLEIPGAAELKHHLNQQYGDLRTESPLEESRENIEQAQGMLDKAPEAGQVYNQALEKIERHENPRNAVDDLRLSLELLLKQALGNDKSLENQTADVGRFLDERNVPKEIRGMFHSLINGYTRYQNEYVKHNNNVDWQEIPFLLALTTAFMNKILQHM